LLSVFLFRQQKREKGFGFPFFRFKSKTKKGWYSRFLAFGSNEKSN